MKMTKEEYGRGYGPWSCPRGGFLEPDPEPEVVTVVELPPPSDRGVFGRVVESIMERLDQAFDVEIEIGFETPRYSGTIDQESLNRLREPFTWGMD